MKKTLFYLFATLLVILWLMPFLISVFTSFKSMDELMLQKNWWEPPKEWHPENYASAWTDANMARYFLNTFIITVPSVIGALFLSSMAAYALAW